MIHRLVLFTTIPALLAAACSQDPTELRKQAEHGDAQAQCDVGLLYAEGLGVSQDCHEARRWSFTADMDGNGTITITDARRWVSWLYYYPGDLLIRVCSGSRVGQFFELSAEDYGGTLSFLVSLMCWILWLVLINEAVPNPLAVLAEFAFAIYAADALRERWDFTLVFCSVFFGLVIPTVLVSRFLARRTASRG